MLPRTLLIVYALPALPLAALTLPLYVVVPTFYSETLGLPLAVVGAALLAVRIFDAVNDPLIGWVADRIRPTAGRRRTLFALALVPAAFAVWMLFAPPPDAGVAYLAVWGAAVSAGFTCLVLPYSAWGAELSGDYAQRSRVTAYREALTLAGTLVAIGLPFAIGMSDPNGWHGLAVLGAVAACALMICGAVAVWFVPEPRNHGTALVAPAQGLARMAANRPFLRLIAAFFINGLANGIPATLFLFFVSAGLDAEAMRGPLLFLYFLAGIGGVPLAAWHAKRVGKHRAWCHAMIVACVVFAFAPLLAPGQVALFAAICLATGLMLGFDLVLPASIQADVIDVDTVSTGEQRSGFYFAAWSLATKLSLAAGVGVVFPMLQWAGFNPAAGAQNAPDALFALAAAYAWAPVALKALAIALMWNFPLDRAAQSGLRDRIESAAPVTVSAAAFSSPSAGSSPGNKAPLAGD